MVSQLLNRLREAVIGPDLSTRRLLIDKVLAAEPVRQVLADTARRVVAANQDGIMLQWELPETPVAAKVKDQNGKEVDGFETPPPIRQLVGHILSQLK